MTTQEVKRKLTAILSADVKEYSRLMSQDEVGTIRTVDAYKNATSEMVVQYKGRVVDSTGDNLMAEFASVVDAVNCAVEVQRELAERNAELPDSRRMEFRIGINLGDVVEEEGRLYGDGVNIAARLQSLAEGGGICISGTVYDQVKSKLGLEYEHLGEQPVKNIAEPVRVYRVLSFPGAAAHRVVQAKSAVHTRYRRASLAIAVVLLIGVGVVLAWHFFLRPTTAVEVASKEKMAFPLPDKPSIAVLPFVNMSEDSKQELLCDGMTEAIITALSKIPRIFVIARNSTFTYKGKPVKVKQVSEDLGVRYVLEGSIQRSGDRIRITAQLIDALTGNHLWAERYDRDLKDIFALQDEITIKILKGVQVKLAWGEVSGSEKLFKGKRRLDCYLKALEMRNLSYSVEDTKMARRIAEQIIEICPESPMAYVMLGFVHQMEYWLGIDKSPRESIEKGIEMAQKALAMDDSISYAHALLSTFYTLKREHEKSIAEAERGLALDPGLASANLAYGMSLTYGGRSEEAIPVLQKAIRLDPLGEINSFVILGHAYRVTKRFEEAVSAYNKAIKREPNNFFAHINLTATYSMMGREKEAQSEAEEIRRLNPKFSVDYYAKVSPYKDRTETGKIIDALRRAGLK